MQNRLVAASDRGTAAEMVSAPQMTAPELQKEQGSDVGHPPDTFNILFVCRGNICRSPYAELAARSMSIAGVAFSSAGVQAIIGHGMDPKMKGLLKVTARSHDHRARQLTRHLAEDADLIVTMSAAQRRWVFEEWPDLGRRSFVIGQVVRELSRLPDHIGSRDIVPHLWAHRTGSPDDDVPDPYRHGRKAAVKAAGIIDRHLDVLERVLRRPLNGDAAARPLGGY